MAISDTQKEYIVGLVVGLFNAAPGANYLRELSNAIEAGTSFEDLADFLVSTPQFQQDILKGNVTVSNQVSVLLNNFGLAPGNTDPASPAAAFADVAALFKNKILVAGIYSRENSDDNVADLQAILAGVTAAGPANEADAMAYLEDLGFGENPGSTFTLTIGEDKLTGTTNNDIFDAPVIQSNAGTTIDTLESFDIIDGNTGTDTLNATINSGRPAPVLKNIENVNLRFTAAQSVDLSSSSGVETVTLANGTAVGTVTSVGSAANLAVKNQVQNANFSGSTAATLGLALDTVGNFTTPTQTVVNLGSAVPSKATTLNVTANNTNAEVTDSNAGEIIKTLSIAASGENILKMTEAAKATSVTVSGEGSVDLTGAAFTGALTKFDAATNTGGVQANIQSTAAATVTTGDGADTIDMDTVVTKDSSVALGKGDDKLYVGAQLANLNKGADGGEGTDIINITDGATLDATNSKFITNFETLDVSGGTGNYDVSLNNFATVQIDEAINGALAGAVDFKNAPDSFTLNIASEAGTGADFAVGNTITVTGKDYTGATATADAETFTLVATIHDGDEDNVANGNIVANAITVADVEHLVIDANVGTLDGGTDALAASEHTLKAAITAAAAETLTIKGDASVDLSGVTTIGVVSKVDATTSKGNVTIDFSTQGNSVAYNGSEGVDTYKGSAKGDVIYTAQGADVVTLGAAGARDTFVLKAATDSQITDTNEDGKIDLTNDTGFDEIVVFNGGGGLTNDRLDVTNFAFSGAQRGVSDVSGSVTAATDLTSIADLFNTPAGDRGVAYSSVGANIYAFIDANKDGNFTAADDLIVKLTGVATLSETDINF
ncbi:hypothetical protein C8R30_11150 [Nitrosomonas nitrosa]|uniref:beta strand repeat-containing protein n=1 Tax=Nitrosomonas nitrosa TaxID=52442 RepID=UPI000D31F980|nr:hypothetical protein [Nitrosomonas nitrosa]PTQ97471.1 hypothetical protein C8R30_11150 [Nitrosomonas nitrosa]